MTPLDLAGIKTISMTSRSFSLEVGDRARFPILDLVHFVADRVSIIAQEIQDEEAHTIAPWFDPCHPINQ